jgi:DNA-binding protein Fis
VKVLDTFWGNRTMAAKALGLARKTLYRKLEQYRAESGGQQASGST